MNETLQKKILIVDDESDVTELLEYQFRKAGYAVRALTEPLRVLGVARDFRPDVIVLDVMMPELSGLQLLRMVRTDSLLRDVPVLLLTARTETEDRVRGLEIGADDYVPKPFDTRELLLRVQAVLKRAGTTNANNPALLSAGKIMLDIERHEVRVVGKKVELTATEFNLLRLLLERKDRVQTRDRLLADVWSYSADLETRTVDTHVRRLREKLGPAGDIIETVRGVGYKIGGYFCV